MKNEVRVITRAEQTETGEGKMSKILEFKSGSVEIPINKDGSVKWFDDHKLLKGAKKDDV